MISQYYMIRVFTPFFYTLEFLIAIIVFIFSLYFYVKRIDRNSLLVFLIVGMINSGVELLLQGIGIRVVENACLFSLPIGFPFIAFILGFYEGGVKTLLAYHFVKFIIDKKRYNELFLSFLVIIVFIPFFIYSIVSATQIGEGTTNITITVRDMLAPLSIFLLILAFILSISYFILNESIPKERKMTLLYYEFGVVVYLLIWMVPLHVFLQRYIGIFQNNNYIPASIVEQILFMYVYFLFFEGVGVNIIMYPIIYHFKLIEFENL